MSDELTEHEKALIEQALIEGKVTKCPPGTSSEQFQYKWDPHRSRLIPLADNAGWRVAQMNAARRGTSPEVRDRRARVVALREEGYTNAVIQKMLNMSDAMILADIKAINKQRRYEGEQPLQVNRSEPAPSRRWSGKRKVDKVKELYDNGMHVEDIASSLNMSTRSCLDYHYQLKVKPRRNKES